jgi:hypothetical protein
MMKEKRAEKENGGFTAKTQTVIPPKAKGKKK